MRAKPSTGTSEKKITDHSTGLDLSLACKIAQTHGGALLAIGTNGQASSAFIIDLITTGYKIILNH